MRKILFIILLFSVGANVMWSNRYKSERIDNDRNRNNYKSVIEEKNQKYIQQSLTINEIKQSNDSLIKELNSVRKELDIKDKQLLEMTLIKEEVKHADSVVITDTIFVENFKLDTIIGDKYLSMKLNFEYPNTIKYEPTISNNKFIYTKVTKEYAKPKKIFPLFLFQRKVNVVEIIVKDDNPYFKNKTIKHIKIF